jgi:hypothetical protein
VCVGGGYEDTVPWKRRKVKHFSPICPTNRMRCHGNLLVVLTLSAIAAIATPAAAGQATVPVGLNQCDDVETLWKCDWLFYPGNAWSDECYNRLKAYAATKPACATYRQQTKDTVTQPCKAALQDLSSCPRLCVTSKCAQATGGYCDGKKCTGPDDDCCASASEGYCVNSAGAQTADYFGWAISAQLTSAGQPRCSKAGEQFTCCVRNKFRWDDDGETWTHCANDGEVCKCKHEGKVRYGDASSDTWSLPRRSSIFGKMDCDASVFGDPKYGIKKTCQCNCEGMCSFNAAAAQADIEASMKKQLAAEAAEEKKEMLVEAAITNANDIRRIVGGVVGGLVTCLCGLCGLWHRMKNKSAGAGAETSEISGQVVMPVASDVETLSTPAWGAPPPGMDGPPGAIQSQGGPPPMTGPAGYGAPPGGSMPASVTDPSGYGVWEPQQDLKTGKIYWTNHALKKTVWEPPTEGAAVV